MIIIFAGIVEQNKIYVNISNSSYGFIERNFPRIVVDICLAYVTMVPYNCNWLWLL